MYRHIFSFQLFQLSSQFKKLEIFVHRVCSCLRTLWQHWSVAARYNVWFTVEEQSHVFFVGRETLPTDAPSSFDDEVGVLVTTVVVNIVNQVTILFIFCIVATYAHLLWILC